MAVPDPHALSHLPSRAQMEATLAQAREVRAPGPGPEHEQLREAYLGLLKLALCDLTARTTVSVDRTPHGIASQELADGWLKVRSLGFDWPQHGLTMVGLSRLDDLQACVESVVADGIPGDLIEAGTWRGGASMLMRATLDSLGDGREVWVADSFQGFREDLEGANLAAVDFLAVSLDEVMENFTRLGLERGVEFVPGYFEDTMAGLGDRRWALARLDADSRGATLAALETLYPNLSVGGYLIVDDYYVLDECRTAVDEFRVRHEIDEPIEQIDWTCARWRRQKETPMGPATHTSAGKPGGPGGLPVRRPTHTPVPTIEELALQRQAAEMRERLHAAEAELNRIRGTPVARLGRWLRGRS